MFTYNQGQVQSKLWCLIFTHVTHNHCFFSLQHKWYCLRYISITVNQLSHNYWGCFRFTHNLFEGRSPHVTKLRSLSIWWSFIDFLIYLLICPEKKKEKKGIANWHLYLSCMDCLILWLRLSDSRTPLRGRGEGRGRIPFRGLWDSLGNWYWDLREVKGR